VKANNKRAEERRKWGREREGHTYTERGRGEHMALMEGGQSSKIYKKKKRRKEKRRYGY